MKVAKQYRFFIDKSNENTKNADLIALSGISSAGDKPSVENLVFRDKNIYQIGIQALPGTKFYLNNGLDNLPAIIGLSGLFEISLESDILIKTIRFDYDSLLVIRDNPSAFIIIDTIEEDES